VGPDPDLLPKIFALEREKDRLRDIQEREAWAKDPNAVTCELCGRKTSKTHAVETMNMRYPTGKKLKICPHCYRDEVEECTYCRKEILSSDVLMRWDRDEYNPYCSLCNTEVPDDWWQELYDDDSEDEI
jgi:hypothetical protein